MYNLYRLYCETEEVYVETWGVTAPTECPNDPGHDIDLDSITIIENTACMKCSVKESSAPYEILTSDTYCEVHGTTAADNDIYTLPTAANNLGRRIKFTKIDAGAGSMVVTPQVGDSLAGIVNGTWSVNQQWGFVEFIATSQGWVVCGGHNSCIYAYSTTADFLKVDAAIDTYYPVTNAELAIVQGKYELDWGCQAVGVLENMDPVSQVSAFLGLSTANSGAPNIRWKTQGIHQVAGTDTIDRIYSNLDVFKWNHIAVANQTLYLMVAGNTEEETIRGLNVYAGTGSPIFIRAKRIS